MAIKTYGVHDQWVDLDRTNNVEIKSTDGVIDSVKINGEEHGGGGGGSSDFSTANLHVSCLDGYYKLYVAFLYHELGGVPYTTGYMSFEDGDEDTLTVLIPANSYARLSILDANDELTQAQSATGAIRYLSGHYNIAGDCSIVLSAGVA